MFDYNSSRDSWEGWYRRPALLVGVLLATATLGQTPAARMPQDLMFFTVGGAAGQTFEITPIVAVHYGAAPELKSTLPGDPTSEEFVRIFDRFENVIYKSGNPVSMFLGGKKIGTGTVSGNNLIGKDGGGCVLMSGKVLYSGEGVPLLAANTSAIPGHGSTRRTATSAESAILNQLMSQWLVDHGLDKSLVRQGILTRVISTELRKGGGRALIGRLDVIGKTEIQQLFAIAEKDGPQYRLTLTNLKVQHDLDDGQDQEMLQYVDQLDITNDGIDEVIVSSEFYEAQLYSIWTFDSKDRFWRKIYNGGGGGC